jgi:hypothetical protein
MVMSAPHVEETLTDFLRHHKKVLKQVDKHAVVLRRTGGKPAVRLSLESDASANDARLSMLAAAVAAVPKGSARALFVNRLFPWSRFLPEHDRSTFEDSLIETLQACASLGNFAKLDEMVGDWKATALVHADPELAADLKRPIANDFEIPVPRPQMPRRRRAQKR